MSKKDSKREYISSVLQLLLSSEAVQLSKIQEDALEKYFIDEIDVETLIQTILNEVN